MRARWLVTLVAAAALGGCAAGESANPNLVAPKLVLQARPDGSVTIFVHAAFGEHLYDWIALQQDNATVANRTSSFSLEETLPANGFYFEVAAGTAHESYELRGRVDVELETEEARVALLDEDNSWNDARSYDLPFERVLARRSG